MENKKYLEKIDFDLDNEIMQLRIDIKKKEGLSLDELDNRLYAIHLIPSKYITELEISEATPTEPEDRFKILDSKPISKWVGESNERLGIKPEAKESKRFPCFSESMDGQKCENQCIDCHQDLKPKSQPLEQVSVEQAAVDYANENFQSCKYFTGEKRLTDFDKLVDAVKFGVNWQASQPAETNQLLSEAAKILKDAKHFLPNIHLRNTTDFLSKYESLQNQLK